ncbi:MAG: type II toxin-antitoxin system RelE/ParE family toxin [Thermoproteota archaeon]|nr:type II toxin-antitoxin system RelE/ParE family toxin [Candidatus Brockarchaeota archaeon]
MQQYRVFLERRAFKQLERIKGEMHERIVKTLHILRDEGFSKKLDIIKLRGSKNHYRIRVGKYRILFELASDKTINVYAILPREAAYE